MKQILRMLALGLALCVALAGCNFSTPETVGTVGEAEISSGLYLLAQFDAYQQAAQYASDSQDPGKVSSFLKESITPDAETGESVTVSDFVAETTLKTLREYAAVEQLFTEAGGQVTDEMEAQAAGYAQQLMDSYGELYQANGIGQQTLLLYERNYLKRQALPELLYGEAGTDPVPDSELTSHLENEMVYGCYVTVPLYSSTTFTMADEEQTAEMLSLAQEAAQKAAGAEDADSFTQTVSEALPAVYGVLGDEVAAADLAADFQTGLFTQSQLAAYFSEEAADTLRALQPGETVALQYTDYGLMVMLRLDPLADNTLDELREDILTDMTAQQVEGRVAEEAAAQANGIDPDAAAQLPAKKIVAS